MPRFAANLSMMFTEVPFLDRFDAAAQAGFTAVEFLFPYEHPAEVVGERLRRNGHLFLKEAKAAGLDTSLSVGHSVVPVIVGDSLRAAQLSNDLLAEGINVLPIIHPAVPEGMARLRFFITCNHTEEQIRRAVRLTAEKLKSLKDRNFGLASLDMEKMMQLLPMAQTPGGS